MYGLKAAGKAGVEVNFLGVYESDLRTDIEIRYPLMCVALSKCRVPGANTARCTPLSQIVLDLAQGPAGYLSFHSDCVLTCAS